MAYKYSILAVKNLKRRGLRSWLTILGIFIGITAVIALISLGNALDQAVSSQFVGDLSPDRITVSGRAVIGMPASGDFSDQDVELINSIRGVEIAAPRYMAFSDVKYRGDDTHFPVLNIPDDSQKREMIYDSYDLKVKEGRLLTRNDFDVVMVGDRASRRRGLRTNIQIGDNLEINGRSFRVVGILESTGNQFYDNSLFMLNQEMERVFDLDENYFSIDVKVRFLDEVEEVAETIKEELRRDRRQDPGEEDFEVQTALEAAQAARNILDTINIFVIGIALISLFVGGVGITNTMYTSVLERRKEIGIMKSVGAGNNDILTIFLIEASLLGLVGGIVGAFFGLSLAYLVVQVINNLLPGMNLNIVFSIPLMSGVIAFSLLVGAVSGILPAIQASKLNPVDALRK